MTRDQLYEYYKKVLVLLSSLSSIEIYYTLTDNRKIGAVEKVALLKMHLQNALQIVQKTMAKKDGFAIIIADELNDENKVMKKAIYELALKGDYVQYTNIKKGLYIDYSDQCQGLHLADICAGIFTATLKLGIVSKSEKHKFTEGYNLFSTYSCLKTRHVLDDMGSFKVYMFGVKEVPNDAGQGIAISVSKLINKKLEEDLCKWVHEDTSKILKNY